MTNEEMKKKADRDLLANLLEAYRWAGTPTLGTWYQGKAHGVLEACMEFDIITPAEFMYFTKVLHLTEVFA